MFASKTYLNRRERLKQLVKRGAILLPGNTESPVNYAANPYPFRQDSSFLYYAGVNRPGLALVIDLEADRCTLYGDDPDLESVIWSGHKPGIADEARKAGISSTAPFSRLKADLAAYIRVGIPIHYLSPYQHQTLHMLADWLDIPLNRLNLGASDVLAHAVVSQRSVKEPCEIEEMQNTMDAVTARAYQAACGVISPENYEWQVAGAFVGEVTSQNCTLAYPIICTINGQILHNHDQSNQMRSGNLLLIDAGAESPHGYATDITRTYPVNARFTRQQQDIYEIVLMAQQEAIRNIVPGIAYREVHFMACRVIAGGLKALGLLNGNVEDIVNRGAHALFFPHGLGHLIGLDVHDMENLGEDRVGYDDTYTRDEKFGIAFLRFARKLQPGMTITVEPGIYFIPPLIEKWRSEGLFCDYINYDRLTEFISFGGIRIEDNALVTDEGCQVIGDIPK